MLPHRPAVRSIQCYTHYYCYTLANTVNEDDNMQACINSTALNNNHRVMISLECDDMWQNSDVQKLRLTRTCVFI